jgi:hypothetical protein
MDLSIEALERSVPPPVAVVSPALDIVYRMHTPQPVPMVDDDEDDDGGSGGGNIDPDDDEGWSDDDEDEEDETLWTVRGSYRSPPKRS